MQIVNVDVSRDLIMIEPQGPLQQEDFQHLTRIGDTNIEQNLALNGTMVRTEDFPGEKSFTAFFDLICFMCDHYKLIIRIALVTDSSVGYLVLVLVRQFI